MLLISHKPPYSPRVVVIMLILSTSGWCPLIVIPSKISVFLSTNSQSTGSLGIKSYVLVFSLLSPFIIVAVIKRKSSLQVSAPYSANFVGNESFNIQIKASSIIWLGMGQTLAQGPPTLRIQNGGRPIHRLHWVANRRLGCRRREDPWKEFWQINNQERISYYST